MEQIFKSTPLLALTSNKIIIWKAVWFSIDQINTGCFVLFYLLFLSLTWSEKSPVGRIFTLAKGVWFGELFTSYWKIRILEFMGKGRPKNVWSMIIFIFIEQITFSSCALYWWLRICKNRESKELLTYNIQVFPRSTSGPELFFLFVNGISRSISAKNLLCLFADDISLSHLINASMHRRINATRNFKSWYLF